MEQDQKKLPGVGTQLSVLQECPSVILAETAILSPAFSRHQSGVCMGHDVSQQAAGCSFGALILPTWAVWHEGQGTVPVLVDLI